MEIKIAARHSFTSTWMIKVRKSYNTKGYHGCRVRETP